MTETTTDPLLDDLDLLDDEHRHTICLVCHPTHQPGQPFTAKCGRRAISLGGITHWRPPNPCADCLELLGKPCSRCGS